MQRTMMTSHFDIRAGLCRLLIALLISLGLAACGPGTGGTGTGPSLGFSGSLTATTTAGTSSVTAPGAGCPPDCQQAYLRLEPERVELAAPCLRFVSTGSWLTDAAGLTVVTGTLETTEGRVVATTQATLRLQFSTAAATSPVVTLTLSDALGHLLQGPIPLLRNEAASIATAPACGPI